MSSSMSITYILQNGWGNKESESHGLGADQVEKDNRAKETKSDGADSRIIFEAYCKLSTVQWEWPKVLNIWQANALGALIHPDPLINALGHPLRDPSKPSVCLYNVIDRKGCTRLSMSLKQLEYLQYYIHAMRLADPVWVKHITSLGLDSLEKPHESDKDVGPPEYEDGEEWIRLPKDFIHGRMIVEVEEMYFYDEKELKRYVSSQRRKNKAIEKRRMLNGKDKEDEEKAAEEARQRAIIDNSTPGPGLRRGPERRREYRPRRTDDDSDEEDGEMPATSVVEPSQDIETQIETAKTLSDLERIDLNMEPSQIDTPSEEASTPASDGSEGNFSTAYYEHAKRALFIASRGGFFEAYKTQPGIAGLLDEKDAPPIGKSLFISIRVVTWEADEDILLEVGWSAWWMQESPGTKSENKYEEMHDDGHIIIQDHLLEKKNGHWKPDHQRDYRFGETLPIEAKNVHTTVQEKIKDLAARAGGGPIYIIVHSADGHHADPSKAGLKASVWLRHFKPSGWKRPSYSTHEAVGKTFIIDTSMLAAAAEFDPKDGGAPLKSDLKLDQIAWTLFKEDEMRHPELYGNAGNDAYYNMQVFFALVMAESLESLRELFKPTPSPVLALSKPDVETKRDVPEVIGPESPTPDEAPTMPEATVDPLDDDNISEYSEDDMIKGVYAYGDDGEMIQIA